MIGKITYDDGEIVLEDDGSVSCKDATMKRVVESDLAVYADSYSPSMGTYGASFLNKLANELKGKVEIAKRKQGDKDTIY